MNALHSSRDAPAVAIIMSVHREADVGHFEEAMASLRAQTYRELHLFIFADGPLLLGHEAVLEKHLALTSGNDRLLRSERSGGLPVALNRLIDAALGNSGIAYLARMDADDICMPERIERQVAFMQQHRDIAVCGTWCIEFTEPGVAAFHKKLPTDPEAIPAFMLTRVPVAHPTVMFRRDVLEEGHRYDPTLPRMQDYELWSRLVVAGHRFSNVPEYLLWYRMAPGFYSRRTGIARAWVEIAMRLRYARKAQRMGLGLMLRLAAFFLVRVSPESVKRLAYRHLRN
ncbi:glycosyltransferase [Piscinibacter koreensis]|uniref:Glycosyltransferase n=1 Tax=Piscinibacter koreensis TaxID=2742824 RepID=A0A7Y6NS55_9BURK|nr:glycosyltransferase [Schlegelella koreensis]NUZ08182.1 glycosyltransferase [Schlegelella koreensis]